MKRALLGLFIVGILGSAGVFLYDHQKARQPKRVWVEYVEKYKSGDYEQEWTDQKHHAEAELARQISESPGCIILTRDRNRADYLLSVSVTRLEGGVFGEADLSITASNGDVLLSERFHQSRTSHDDIARMPLRRAWEVLCAGRAWR